MASKRRRTTKPAAAPRRVRRTPNWSFWIWVLAVVNVAGGLWVSPVTAPLKISLRGVAADDAAYVKSVLEDYRTTPWLRLNRYEIESRLGRVGHWESVTFEPNVFGRATVTAVPRTAVARIEGVEGLCLDETGEVYVSPVTVEAPLVKVTGESLDVSACLVGSWPREGVATTIRSMEASLPQLDYSLELDGRSVLSLEISGGATVVLGSSSQLEEKVKKLAELYSSDGGNWTQETVLNLMAPERPTIK